LSDIDFMPTYLSALHYIRDAKLAWRTNVRGLVKLPALASVTEGASPDMTRWIQTLAICRWTKQRKPCKAKGGPPPAASKPQLAAVFALLH
jgi:hypothetical protein